MSNVAEVPFETGRRIYIQEQAVVHEGMRSPERFAAMVRCAASLTIPRV